MDSILRLVIAYFIGKYMVNLACKKNDITSRRQWILGEKKTVKTKNENNFYLFNKLFLLQL